MASLMPNGRQQYLDNNGNPLAGGRVYTYEAGSSTPLATYSDAAGTVPNANPVLLNARGEASIWWGDAPYKIVVKDASDVEIYTQDNAQAPMGRADLASAASGKGAALVGFDGGTLADFLKDKSARVVDSIAALRGLDKTKFTRATVLGYYAAGDGGGGVYWHDGADTATADNAGSVIVATDGGRWKLASTGTISVRQFGAKGDGTTDDTATIQAALDYAIPTGIAVYLPRGVYQISGAGLSVSNTAAGSTGGTYSVNYRTQIYGDGAASSTLRWTGTSGACLTIITGGDSRTQYRDFSVLQGGTTRQGKGIALTETSEVAFDSVTADGFEYGWYCVDNFTVKFTKCSADRCQFGLYATRSTISDPNDFSFMSCNFRDNTLYAAVFDNPCALNFTGGSAEGNGSGVAGQGGIKINGGPKEGIVGVNISGMYFEGNKGSFDVGIYDVGGTPGIHSVTGSTFNRVNSAAYTSANIAFYKTTAAQTKIRVEGNGFAGFNTYVADAARKYIQVPAPVDNNYLVDIGTNIYGNAIEEPDVLGAAGKPMRTGALVRFNGATATIDGPRHNIASVARNAAGDYTVNYSKPLKAAKGAYSIGFTEATAWSELFSESSSHVRFKVKNASGVYADFSNISVVVFGQDGAD